MIRKFTTAALILCLGLSLERTVAQEVDLTEYTIAIEQRMTLYAKEMSSLMQMTRTASEASLDDLERDMNSLDAKWDMYCEAQQVYIADDEQLMELSSYYQQIKEKTAIAISEKKAEINAKNMVNAAEALFKSSEAEFESLSREAEKYSMSDKFANQLEKTKNKGELAFADVEKAYAEAAEASKGIQPLEVRMKALEDKYINIKTMAEKIQSAEYKPFIERAKEYLLGIAVVALIIMVISMIQSKMVAVKQMKENMKKIKEQYIKDGKDDIPSI